MKRLFVPQSENEHRPFLLHGRGLLSVVFVLLAVFLVYPRVLSLIATPAVLGEQSQIKGQEIVELVNQARLAKGLPRLRQNSRLDAAAKLKAEDMITKGYWSHNRPDGRPPWSFLEKAGYEYEVAGENLAKNFKQSKAVVTAWLRSPAHRKNLMEKQFSEVGAGVVYGKLNGVYTSVVVLYLARPAQPKTVRLIRQVLANESGMKNQTVAEPETGSLNKIVDVGRFKSSFAFLILVILLGAVVVDFYLVERFIPKRYHSYSRLHMFFLVVLLILVLLVHPAGLVK
ncbi:MAG: CAP domain-containing protein [bacterium]|nr:CAP domain-containing protein [bacterium]